MMPDWESEVRLSERSRLHVWLSCLKKPGEGEVEGPEGAGWHSRCGPRPTPSLVLHPISASLSSLPFSTWGRCVVSQMPNPNTGRRRAGSCGRVNYSMHTPPYSSMYPRISPPSPRPWSLAIYLRSPAPGASTGEPDQGTLVPREERGQLCYF